MKFHLLPRRSESEHIQQLAEPGETSFVRLEIQSTGYGPITIAGRSTKSYTFRRDPRAGAHSLRVPLSLWMADNGAMARDIMGKPGSGLYKIIPLFEIATPAAEAPQETEPQEPVVQDEPPPVMPEIPELEPENFDEAPAAPDEPEPASEPVSMLMHDDDFDIPDIGDPHHEAEPSNEPQPARRGRPRKK